MNMKTIALTLWDLLAKPDTPAQRTSIKQSKSKPRPIQAKYDALVEQMKETYSQE